jgi:hypothetical protein
MPVFACQNSIRYFFISGSGAKHSFAEEPCNPDSGNGLKIAIAVLAVPVFYCQKNILKGGRLNDDN